jgi:hypothetical protein
MGLTLVFLFDNLLLGQFDLRLPIAIGFDLGQQGIQVGGCGLPAGGGMGRCGG